MRWICLLLLLSTFNLAIKAQGNCVAESQVEVGAYARVTPGEANNVREQPDANAALVGQIPGNGVFEVIGDAVCDERFVWVEVEYGGFTGWTVEADASSNWVEPFASEVYMDRVLRLVYPEDYLKDIIPESIPARDEMGGFYPARQRYSLVFSEDDIPYRWEIILMRVDEINEEAPLASEALDELRTLLGNPQAFAEPIFETTNPDRQQDDDAFPKDPLFRGAQRMLISSPHLVEMQNGMGVAFVTFYTQALSPVTNDMIFYNYLALTDEHFVIVRLPIHTSILPDTYEDFEFPQVDSDGIPVGWEENYANYVSETAVQLNALGVNDWEPSMNTLDSILNSIAILQDFES